MAPRGLVPAAASPPGRLVAAHLADPAAAECGEASLDEALLAPGFGARPAPLLPAGLALLRGRRRVPWWRWRSLLVAHVVLHQGTSGR